ncbi:MAG: phage portal protein [Thermogutta sp.]
MANTRGLIPWLREWLGGSSPWVDPDFDDPWSEDFAVRPRCPGDCSVPFRNEAELAEIRRHCRGLALENEFAVNGHENRISYVVGTGHRYRVVPRTAGTAGEAKEGAGTGWADAAQEVLDEFLEENRWHRRQQEILRRYDRDGEVFLRFFAEPSGRLQVRFVEPEEVACPTRRRDDPAASFGVQTDPSDVERVLGYWIGGQWADAEAVQHRKANVDSNIKRGLPLFYPVRKNLRRAEKLLRNMSVVAGVQSAVALIRKHSRASKAAVERFAAETADDAPRLPGAVPRLLFAPGTVLDAAAGTEYEFPASAIDAARYVTLLQAELRAIASRLVMPEFMLTSDASNANYASTLVAEGPAVRMFQRLQQEMIEDDLRIMRRVLVVAAQAGRLPEDVLRWVAVEAVPPPLAVRDRLKEAQADAVLFRCGAMSRATLALRHGLDPRRETPPRDEDAESKSRRDADASG